MTVPDTPQPTTHWTVTAPDSDGDRYLNWTGTPLAPSDHADLIALPADAYAALVTDVEAARRLPDIETENDRLKCDALRAETQHELDEARWFAATTERDAAHDAAMTYKADRDAVTAALVAARAERDTLAATLTRARGLAVQIAETRDIELARDDARDLLALLSDTPDPL